LVETVQDMDFNQYTLTFLRCDLNENKNAGLCIMFDESQSIYVNFMISMCLIQKNNVGIEMTGRGGSFRQG
jgi:hypothetical protein